MAKFYGIIGFSDSSNEQKPGSWSENIVERHYYGDLIRSKRNLQTSGVINPNITVSNDISIVADDYAIDNFFKIRYIVYKGVKWIASNVEIQRPRLIISLGDVYNG